MVISVYVFSCWRLRSQTPTRALPLDPAVGLLSLVPRFCHPPKQISGYAPGRYMDFTNDGELIVYGLFGNGVICRYLLLCVLSLCMPINLGWVQAARVCRGDACS